MTAKHSPVYGTGFRIDLLISSHSFVVMYSELLFEAMYTFTIKKKVLSDFVRIAITSTLLFFY